MSRRRGGSTLRVVTHPHEQSASAAAAHAPPIFAVLAGAFLVLCTILPVLLVARSAWSARSALRECPVCGGRAVRDGETEYVGFIETQVTVQCGQCGIWRRLVVNPNDERAHARRLARDRRRIRRLLARLEAARREIEIRGFIGRLQTEIGGADDFLATTRPPANARAVRQRRPPREH
jgi:hypothetical protein